MKLAPRTFKIQWDLHAWAGVIASVWLFVSFYCGVFALFHAELSRWQDASVPAADSGASFGALFAELGRQVPVPRGASLEITREAHGASAWVIHEPTHLQKQLRLGQPARGSEHSRLADELYLMHFAYHLPGGTELSGCMAVLLLVALVSGVVIHWKDLARQAWQFRPWLRLRISASDAHKVLGVFGLPFAAMIGWSGASLGLFTLLASPFAQLVYRGDQAALDRARGYAEPQLTAAESVGPMLPIDALVSEARAIAGAHWPGAGEPVHVGIEAFEEPGALVSVAFARAAFEPEKRVHLNAHTAELVELAGEHVPPAARIDRVLFDLHYALFGGLLVKVSYALLALGVCAVLLTGNLIWLERRAAQAANASHRALARGTLGACFGLVLASALYFVANRCLPSSLPARADLEFGVFLGVWAASVAGAFGLRQVAPRRIAAWLCGSAALGFAGVALHGVFSAELTVTLLLGLLAASCAAVARRMLA